MVVAQRKYSEVFNEVDVNYGNRINKTPEQKPKVTPKRKIGAKLSLIFQILLGIGVILYLLGGQLAIARTRMDLNSLEREITSLEKEKQNLYVKLASMDDIGKIEQRAIHEMGMKKPDDTNTIRLAVRMGSDSVISQPQGSAYSHQGIMDNLRSFYKKIVDVFN